MRQLNDMKLGVMKALTVGQKQTAEEEGLDFGLCVVTDMEQRVVIDMR